MPEPEPPRRERVHVPVHGRVGVADLDLELRRLERRTREDGGAALRAVLRVRDGLRRGEIVLASEDPIAWIKGHRVTLVGADARGVDLAIDLDAAG